MKNLMQARSTTICNICKNIYYPTQFVYNVNTQVINCVDCSWHALFMTKIYPGEKSPDFYTPHPDKPQPKNKDPTQLK